MTKFKPLTDYTSNGNDRRDKAFHALVRYTAKKGGNWYYIDVVETNTLIARDAPTWADPGMTASVGYKP